MALSNITLSAGVRSNLLNLQNTADLKNTTQERLSTGKKVNSALDNPSNYFTASALSSRANDLSNLLDGISNGIQVLQAATNGIDAITSSIESLQSTVQQARADSSYQTASYTVDAATIGTATAKTLTLSGGSLTSSYSVALNTVGTATAAHQATVTSTANYAAPSVGTSPGAAVLTETTAATAGATGIDLSGGSDAIAFSINGHAVSIDAAALNANGGTAGQGSAANLAAAITASAGAQAAGVTATVDGSNHLVFTSTATGTGASAAITGFSETATAGTSGIANGSAAGTVGTSGGYAFTVNGHAVTLDSTGTGASAGDTGAHAAASISSQLSAFGISATYDATSQKLTLTGAADGSNSITVAGTDAAAVFGTALTNTGTTATAGGAVKTVDQLVTDINTNLAGKVKATNDGGKLQIENISTSTLTATGFNSTSAEWDGSTGTTTVGGDTVRTNLVDQFNQVKDQLDKLASDAGFNGINLLNGDALKLTFNETSTSSLTIQSSGTLAGGITAANLGITDATNAEFGSDDQLDTRLTQLSTALTTLRSQSSAFGSNLSIVQNRQDFTKNMINTLQVGSDNLTLADTNEEGANLLALNTRQQLETTSLSFASQADQAVLQFLR